MPCDSLQRRAQLGARDHTASETRMRISSCNGPSELFGLGAGQRRLRTGCLQNFPVLRAPLKTNRFQVSQ